MPTHVKSASVWTMNKRVFVKSADVWSPAKKTFARSNGTWYQGFGSITRGTSSSGGATTTTLRGAFTGTGENNIKLYDSLSGIYGVYEQSKAGAVNVAVHNVIDTNQIYLGYPILYVNMPSTTAGDTWIGYTWSVDGFGATTYNTFNDATKHPHNLGNVHFADGDVIACYIRTTP